MQNVFVRLLGNRAIVKAERSAHKAALMFERRRVLGRALLGWREGIGYFREIRARTVAFVFKTPLHADIPPSPNGTSTGSVRIKGAEVLLMFRTFLTRLRKTCVAMMERECAHTCKRAVMVGSRWGAHELPAGLRSVNYEGYERRLRGGGSEYLYDPVLEYLKPSLELELREFSVSNSKVEEEGAARAHFDSPGRMVNKFGAFTGVDYRTSLRVLYRFMERNVAVDPWTLYRKLPTQYSVKGDVVVRLAKRSELCVCAARPSQFWSPTFPLFFHRHALCSHMAHTQSLSQIPKGYGINTKGVLTMFSSVTDTVAGAFVVMTVRKCFWGWKRVVGFKMLMRVAFEWGRRRILKLGWKGLHIYWSKLRDCKVIGEAEGARCLLVRMIKRWRFFATKTRSRKVLFVKRTFVRRVHFIYRAWKGYARRKGERGRRADKQFRKWGVERGFGLWRSHYVREEGLNRLGAIMRKRVVTRVLKWMISEWYRKIVINRRLLVRVFTIHRVTSEAVVFEHRSDFAILLQLVKGWRTYCANRTATLTARIQREGRERENMFNVISRVFLGWQRVTYVALCAREFREERVREQLRWIIVEWERWSYKVVGVRRKHGRTKVLRVHFTHFARGCVVSRKGEMTVLRRRFEAWVRRWRWEWGGKGEEWRVRCLKRLVFKEWKWCAMWAGGERKFVSEVVGGSRVFDYRPHMKVAGGPLTQVEGGVAGGVTSVQEGAEAALSGGVVTSATRVAGKRAVYGALFAIKTRCPLVHADLNSSGPGVCVGGLTLDHAAGDMTGRDAVVLYYHCKLLQRKFSYWGGISARHAHLRRNMGRLSRLANMIKLKDAFSRFPGATLSHKVDAFVRKRVLRQLFGEWKVMSKSYVKRKGDEVRSDMLRQRNRLDMEKRVVLGEKSEEDERFLGYGGGGSNQSFLMGLGVGAVGTMGKAWRGWRDVAANGRMKRYGQAVKLKERDRALVKTVFEGWSDCTHFIFRRHSWGNRLTTRVQEREGERGGLRDRSNILMNYMNTMGRAAVESSFVSSRAEKWSREAGGGRGGESMDIMINDLRGQWGR